MCPTTIQGAPVDIPRKAQIEDRQFPGLPDSNFLPSLMPPMALIQQICAQINGCQLPDGFFSSIQSANQLVQSMGADGSVPVENPMRDGRYEIPSVNQRPYSQEYIATPNAPATMAPYVPPPILSPYSGPTAPLSYAATPSAYQHGPQPQVTSGPYAAPVTTPAPYQPAMSTTTYPSVTAPAPPMAMPNSNNSYSPLAAPSFEYTNTTIAPYSAPASIAPNSAPTTATPYAAPPKSAPYLRPPIQAVNQSAPPQPRPSAPFVAPTTTRATVYPSASVPAVPMTSNSYKSSTAPSYQYPTTTVAPSTTSSYHVYPTTTTAATPTYPYPSTAMASRPLYLCTKLVQLNQLKLFLTLSLDLICIKSKKCKCSHDIAYLFFLDF